METGKFETGQRILWNGTLYVLLSKATLDGIDFWHYVPSTGDHISISSVSSIVQRSSEDDLQREYFEGRLTFDNRREGETPEQSAARRDRPRVPLSDLPEKDYKDICFRRDLVRRVQAQFPDGGYARRDRRTQGGKSLVLEKVLAELGHELGIRYYGTPRKVSVASFYRYRSKLEVLNEPRDLATNRSACGNRNRTVTKVREIINKHILVELQSARRRRNVGQSAQIVMADIIVKTYKEIKELKELDPSFKDAKLPCRATFYNCFAKFPQESRDHGSLGPTHTRARYRYPRGHDEPAAALSQTQYDETQADVFCVDDFLGIPLGRPYASWIVDVYSGAILGFYIGFEPPGDVVFGSVLRHAILPKTYVQAAFPDINAPYPMAGIPRVVTYDNSLSAHGGSIARLMGDFDIAYDFTPSRMPWVKGEVEGMFRRLNTALLSLMPGYVLSDKLARCDYDPARNGVIGLYHLIYIFHKWLLEHYHATTKLNGQLPSPNHRWRDGTRIVKSEFPVAGGELDFLFGIIRDGRTLDNRGLIFQGLRYYSDDGHDIRRAFGPNVKVKIKINPLNLGSIHCFNSDQNVWVKCLALDPLYAGGLDLHRHNLYRKYARERWGGESLEDYARARIALQELIAAGLPDALGMRTNSLIARALGLGTHTMFENHHAAGPLRDARGVLRVPPTAAALPPPTVSGSVDARRSSDHMRAPVEVPVGRPPKSKVPVFKASRILMPR